MAYKRVNWENLPSTKTPVNADNLNKMDEGIANAVEKSDLLNLIYPVGSIYISVNSTNPANLFGGTWQQIKDRFLLACGSTYNAGATGGEAKHTLTINEMPSHRHQLTENGEGPSLYPNWGTKSGWGVSSQHIDGNGGIVNSALTGGGQAHNNMPPYLAVYIWKRIS